MTDNNQDGVNDLRDSLRTFLEAECSSEKLRSMLGKPETMRTFNQRLAELGWMAVAVPELHGGMNLGLIELAMVYEELGRRLAPTSLLHNQLVVDALVGFGDPTSCAKYLPRIAAGELTATAAVMEDTTLRLAAEEDNLVLSGRQDFLLGGADADLWLVCAQTQDGGEAWILLDAAENSVPVLRRDAVDATRHFGSVECDALIIAAGQVIADGERAVALRMRLTDHAALALACESNGAAQTIFDLTVEYLKTRTQFDKPIGAFQALKHRVAGLKVKMEVSRAATAAAVSNMLADTESSKWASIAKFTACDMYAAVATDAVQLHGGIGYTWEHDCHLFLKRAKLNQQLFGDTQWHRDRVATLLAL